VGAERELTARGAAEGEPRPRGRSRSALGHRELDEAHGERVDLEREDAADVERSDSGVEEREEERAQAPGCGQQLGLVPGAQDRVAKGERAARLQACEI